MVEKIYSAHSVHKFIEDALKDPKLRAILWASAPKLMKKREGSFERHENVDFKLAAYLIRASSRSTPSGLLAGISVGKISTSQSDLSLKSNCEYEMAADLDVVFQEKVKELDIQCEGGIKSGNYSLNPAIDFIENTLIVETQLEKYKSIEMRPDIIVFLKKLGVTSKYSLFEIRRRIQKEFSTNKAAAIALERILLQNSILVKVDGYTTISNSPPKAMALLNSKAQKEFRKELDGLQRQNPFECADKIRILSIKKKKK
ncbi:MAG: lantibiotic dehydratase, partial [Bdellovibrionales bacterium]|nr:lantibiotic dehydratase [Bdellovibrionales bacterium]